VFLRELRQPERRIAERALGTGRRAAASPHRPHDPGRSPRWQPRAVHVPVSGLDASLWCDARSHECVQRARERRLRAEPSALQGDLGAGAAFAWQPGLRQPGGVRAVFTCSGGPAQREPGGEVRAGAGASGSVAGASAGDVGTSAGARGPGQHDSGEEEHLLGAGALAGGVGRGAYRCRGGRGMVRGFAGTDDGTLAWPVEAPHRLSSRDRLAGAQARGIRTLCLPRGPVPDANVPAGL